MNNLAVAIDQMPYDLIEGSLYDGAGHYCAVGFMAHLIGIPDSKMLGDSGRGLKLEVYKAVEEAYGLAALNMTSDTIYSVNDASTELTRRAKVIDRLVVIGYQLTAKHEAEMAKT